MLKINSLLRSGESKLRRKKIKCGVHFQFFNSALRKKNDRTHHAAHRGCTAVLAFVFRVDETVTPESRLYYRGTVSLLDAPPCEGASSKMLGLPVQPRADILAAQILQP